MSQVRNQPTTEGREAGRELVRLIAEPGVRELEESGEPDARCASCAFRLGTFPNGCPETVMDALRAVLEGTPFYCHMKGPTPSVTCHGWYAGRVLMKGRVVEWPFTEESRA